ncbi:MAG TPA: secretin N-terminal domain-containing protein [Gammaproteobacteria bacterium]|nr:secretin N-terminal domain-containing protein [Gammaproteobacteria bacterium]
MTFCTRVIILFISILFCLTGCNSPVYNQAEANVADVAQRQSEAKARMVEAGRPDPTLIINQGLYVDRTPISISRQPSWLRNRIVLRGDQLPFSFYARTAIEGGGRNILSHYQTGLNDKVTVSMNYTGTVKGALDLLAANTGYNYYVNGKDIYWQAFVTKTFDIAFVPGSSDYMMGKAAGGGSSSGGASGASGGPSSVATISGFIDDSAASQYSNMKGTLSVWKDLETSIKQLLSPDGKVMVSEATTSVTVRDRLANVNLISRFINNVNNNLSKQVLVKVEILQVTLENDFNFGINWKVIQRAFNNGTYNLTSLNGTPIAITSVTQLTGGPTVAGVANSFINNAGATDGATGVQSLINALQQQGKVSLVTQPQVLCQNNQVSQIRLIEQQGYLQSVQSTSLAGGSGTSGTAAITSQLTPGAVISGLTLYVLPKILGNKVYLQVNADLSNNQGFQTISSNGQPITAGTTPAANTTAIQLPTVQQRQFNQRSVISSGDTLILAGFRQVTNHLGAQQLFDSQALGGKTAQQVSTETVVLITPIILHGLA